MYLAPLRSLMSSRNPRCIRCIYGCKKFNNENLKLMQFGFVLQNEAILLKKAAFSLLW